jgi:hypothetical protein
MEASGSGDCSIAAAAAAAARSAVGEGHALPQGALQEGSGALLAVGAPQAVVRLVQPAAPRSAAAEGRRRRRLRRCLALCRARVPSGLRRAGGGGEGGPCIEAPQCQRLVGRAALLCKPLSKRRSLSRPAPPPGAAETAAPTTHLDRHLLQRCGVGGVVDGAAHAAGKVPEDAHVPGAWDQVDRLDLGLLVLGKRLVVLKPGRRAVGGRQRGDM